jgi:hypothetical protein
MMTGTRKSTTVTGVIASLLALVVFVQATIACVPPPPPPPGPGCDTPGYWKNHPEAWPVDIISVGGVDYTQAEAIEWMCSGGKGDKTLTMFGAVVAAKLNVLIGNDDSKVADTIAAVDAWMAVHPVGSGVKANSEAWKLGDPLYQTLDNYNNNLL